MTTHAGRAPTKHEILAQAQQFLAQTHLVDYGQHVLPWFDAPKHIRYLADLLERAERGEIKRLAISIAPGHGKSTLLQAFVCWFLGRNPRRRILALSATEKLAQRNSRMMRSMVQSEEWPWPGIQLEGESLEEWYVKQGGGVRTIGQTGTVTGFRAEMVLCDDVQPDAGTEGSRKDLETWFRGVLTTRLEPDGIAVVIQTRWHDDDLIGRLAIGESRDQWEFVNIPVFAAENDPLGRAPGEALWPERWPIEILNNRRIEVGPSDFSAQYMGDPVPAGGTIFEPKWFENIYENLVLYKEQTFSEAEIILSQYGGIAPPPRMKTWYIIQAVDSAWKTGLTNDRSCIVTLAFDGRHIFVVDVWYGRLAYPDLRRKLVERFDMYHPSRVYVEEAQSGYALVADLERSTSLPIVGVNPGRESKVARAEGTTGWWEAGRIKLPPEARWLLDFKDEFLRFPYGRHDDIVDATTLGVRMVQHRQAQVDLSQVYAIEDDLSDWMGR